MLGKGKLGGWTKWPPEVPFDFSHCEIFFLSWEVLEIVQYFLLYSLETDAFHQAVNILKSELFLYYKLTDTSRGTKVSDEILLRIKVFEICGPNS